MPTTLNTTWKTFFKWLLPLVILITGGFVLGLKLMNKSKKSNDSLSIDTRSGQPEVSLSIDTKPGQVMATLVFKNHSNQDIFLEKEKSIILENFPQPQVFEGTVDGKKITHLLEGKIPESEPKLEDYVKIEPGKQLEQKTILNKAYRFLPGSHHYIIFYKAYHSSPFSHQPKQLILQSNQVEFDYAGSPNTTPSFAP